MMTVEQRLRLEAGRAYIRGSLGGLSSGFMIGGAWLISASYVIAGCVLVAVGTAMHFTAAFFLRPSWTQKKTGPVSLTDVWHHALFDDVRINAVTREVLVKGPDDMEHQVIGVLEDGVTVEQAEAEITEAYGK